MFQSIFRYVPGALLATLVYWHFHASHLELAMWTCAGGLLVALQHQSHSAQQA